MSKRMTVVDIENALSFCGARAESNVAVRLCLCYGAEGEGDRARRFFGGDRKLQKKKTGKPLFNPSAKKEGKKREKKLSGRGQIPQEKSSCWGTHKKGHKVFVFPSLQRGLCAGLAALLRFTRPPRGASPWVASLQHRPSRAGGLRTEDARLTPRTCCAQEGSLGTRRGRKQTSVRLHSPPLTPLCSH